MKFTRAMISTHQSLGLLIGIQVLLWITGGVVMSVIPIESVRGEDWIAEHTTAPVTVNQTLREPVAVARELALSGFDSAEVTTWLDRPVYRLRAEGSVHLVDAVTGQQLSPLDGDTAIAVARRDYAGPGDVADVVLLAEPLSEIRGRQLPLWRINFDDNRHTTIYVSPQTGKVVGRRNTTWRVYDFFWMLHIMDYGARDNFNNPLLVAAAVAAWLLATSGIWLVVVWLRRRSRRRSVS